MLCYKQSNIIYDQKSNGTLSTPKVAYNTWNFLYVITILL